MQCVHHGSGIVSFSEFVVTDWDSTDASVNEIINTISHDNYAPYIKDSKSLSEYPSKFQNFSAYKLSKKTMDMLSLFDSALVEALLKYCKLFVSSSWDVSWKTPGMLINYAPGQGIGAHTDNTITVNYQNDEIINQYALHNTITAALIVNDAYSGGETLFPNWDISIHGQRGTVIIYPSSYIGFHQISPIKTGNRVAYLSWFGHGVDGSQDYSKYTNLSAMMGDLRKNYPTQKAVKVGRYIEGEGGWNEN